MHQVTSNTLSNIDLILHINMTIVAWLVPQLNASTSFFTLARFFGHQAIACPSPLLSTLKPFLAIFTISSHQVTSCVESTIHLYCYLFHFNLASFKYETILYAIPHVSSTNLYRACFHIVHGNPTMHEFYLYCCLVLELDCLYNNTSFLLSLNSCEMTYYLSTLSKRLRPLITLSFNHPKPTKGLDALSIFPFLVIDDNLIKAYKRI